MPGNDRCFTNQAIFNRKMHVLRKQIGVITHFHFLKSARMCIWKHYLSWMRPYHFLRELRLPLNSAVKSLSGCLIYLPVPVRTTTLVRACRPISVNEGCTHILLAEVCTKVCTTGKFLSLPLHDITPCYCSRSCYDFITPPSFLHFIWWRIPSFHMMAHSFISYDGAYCLHSCYDFITPPSSLHFIANTFAP